MLSQWQLPSVIMPKVSEKSLFWVLFVMYFIMFRCMKTLLGGVRTLIHTVAFLNLLQSQFR
ncbi:hypothetical protein O9992_28200 [Vibrio lentus]|nr:hypothetical protein [Vibrio lentus]